MTNTIVNVKMEKHNINDALKMKTSIVNGKHKMVM